MKKILFIIVLFLLSIDNISSANIFQLRNLMTEYASQPLGIDVIQPRFSWQMDAGKMHACSQSAYAITVTDEAGNIVWNTGKVNSDNAVNIAYEGKPLRPSTRYSWKLNVWNDKGIESQTESWFETGLMGNDSWDGAKWIGASGDDMVLYPQYLSVFRIHYTLQIDRKSNQAGFVYGANDERLMDKNKNNRSLAAKKDESYVMLFLDVSNDSCASLSVYRAGYAEKDSKDKPLKVFRIDPSIINKNNKYAKHTVELSSEYGLTRISIDHQDIGEVGINPNGGGGGNYIAYPVIGDIGFTVPAHQSATFSDVEIRNFRSPNNIISAQANEIRVNGNTNGWFHTFTPQCRASIMVRSNFTAYSQPIVKARLYATARGIYDVYLNGKRLNEDYFNPGLTQYNKTMLYQTYDVTNDIVRGENTIGAQLAEGWWSGAISYVGSNWNFFGDRQSFLAKLIITYADGKQRTVTTDPSTWQYFNDGPVRYGSLFQGEVYDANVEKRNERWCLASSHADGWKQCVEVPTRGTTPVEMNFDDLKMVGQYGQTVKEVKRLTAISMEEVRPHVYVYDMGQNMAGVPSIQLSGLATGTKVTLRYAEMKYPDMPEYKDNVGMLMLENIRAAMAQDIYIARGGEESYSPRFTFHGYRYIEITGIDHALPLSAVKGLVLSSADTITADYATSNEKVNRLWQNIVWSTRANFLSIPTDCPQRNERMGWSGDISVFSRTATYTGFFPQFLRRHLQAMRDTQSEEGRFSDVAPVGGGFGGLLWGSAGITIPWECYQQYADYAMLQEHYDAMRRYMDFVLKNYIDRKSNLVVQTKQWGDLGDWLSPEEKRNDNALLWDAYLDEDLTIMQKVANILGKSEDANRYNNVYQLRKPIVNKTFFDRKSGKSLYSENKKELKGSLLDTQASYTLPLAFNLVDDSLVENVVNNLVNAITRENKADDGTVCPPYSLMTGFIGTAWINKALSDHGRSDIAYRLLQNTSYPSWLYPVEQGATTIWERLNSYTKTNGFGGNNRMNSFNHYSFGAVGAWMYAYSLGIQRDENSPGFKHFILRPEIDPTGNMTSAHGHYDSMYGRIESGWAIDKEKVTYHFCIPANTTATLYLPSNNKKSLERTELPSGEYSFSVKRWF
jgi:alpha-L-rhamnosidase